MPEPVNPIKRHRPNRNKTGTCPLCHRSTLLTFHHLIPRKVHRRAHFQKHFDRTQLNRGIFICRLCHRGIHRRHDEMTLARHFNTLELLLEDIELVRHFAWVARQKMATDDTSEDDIPPAI